MKEYAAPIISQHQSNSLSIT